MSQGRVYLVGAGPGDPSLITVKGIECLKRAEVVVYDHLLDEVLLGNCPPQAERIYAGKRAAHHALRQEEINALLVAKAKSGKTVVRLKGGDPFVLGRGGEEGEALRAEGIKFEVVPGVTSAVAVPSYAGIPVTHRGLASSFAVITGHEDPTKETSSLNWEYLAKGADTLVFLMGTQNLEEIASKLVSNGRDLDTPAAVISNGTRPNQQTVTGTLGSIADEVDKSGLKPPAIIVVGKVVSMREHLNWFEDRPLFGKRVLVTRARHQASAMSELLAERGAIPIELPAIEIGAADTTGVDDAISRLSKFDWLVFTSVNGVSYFFERVQALGKDSRALGGVSVAAIGPATAEAIRRRGIRPDFVPTEFTSEGILADIRARNVSGKRFLLARADIADQALVDGLRKLGADVEEVVAYQTRDSGQGMLQAKEAIAAGEVDVVTFASSSTVKNLMSALGRHADLHGAKVACIGPKTADAAREAGLNLDIVATESTIASMVDAIEDYFRKEK